MTALVPRARSRKSPCAPGAVHTCTNATVQPFLDVRTAVLNDTLGDAFRRRHPGFRPADTDHRLTAIAA